MNKKIIVIGIILIISIVGLSGCITEPIQTQVPNLPNMTLKNDLASGELTITSDIEGLYLTREYSTTYNTSQWRITDSKNIMIKCSVLSIPNGTTVLVEHMHADISLKSVYESFDGIPQDSMDDSIHGGLQPGFYITDNHPYECVFAIQGYSQTLISGWGFVISGYGSMTVKEYRLTETNLDKTGGVYGNKIQIVYDLAIKNDTEPYFHTVSFIDEFMVIK